MSYSTCTNFICGWLFTVLQDWVQYPDSYCSFQLYNLIHPRSPPFEQIPLSDTPLVLPTTWLMVGLLVEVEDTQSIAISTAFQAEFMLKAPCNLGSTIFMISPWTSMKLTHWLMWIFSSANFSITVRHVIILKRTTPKLYTSLFSVNLYELQYL